MQTTALSEARAVHIDEESPFWARTAPAAVEAPPLRGDLTADVGVIGAGFLGLSTALHLREAGAQVTVIEAQEPGAGASGRNTGFVIPNFPSPAGPDAAIEAFGSDAGAWLVGRIGGAADFAFGLMERLGIDCHPDRLGWAQAAHSPDMLDSLATIADGWQRHGFAVKVLDQAETTALIGFSKYAGCMVFRRGGQINPLAYVRGLASAAVERGVTLGTRSPVLHIERRSGTWLVRTPGGSLQARQLVLTANVAMKTVLGTAAPLRISHMMQAATTPLPADAPFKGPSLPFSDTAPHPNFALRTTRDGRLVTGGEPELARQRLAAAMPGQAIEIEYTWGGDTAHTDNLMPRFREAQPGLFEAVGCNGRGVAFTSAFGAMIADYLTRPDGDARFMAQMNG